MAVQRPCMIAVGGRWREIEEQNLQLGAALSELGAQAEGDRRALHRAQAELEAEVGAASRGREELHEVRAEARASAQEVAALRRALAYQEEVAARAEALAEERQATIVCLGEACSEAERGRAAEADAANRCRARLAGRTVDLDQETRRSAEAAARSEALACELASTEERLSHRGTHVDRLLREKERLWSQLEQLRASTTTTIRSGGCEAAHKRPTAPGRQPRTKTCGDAKARGRLQPRAASAPRLLRGQQPPASAGNTQGCGQACSSELREPGQAAAASPGGPPRALTSSAAPARAAAAVAAAAACVAASSPPAAVSATTVVDLERKLWQAHRALQRERGLHTQTNEELASLRRTAMLATGVATPAVGAPVDAS